MAADSWEARAIGVLLSIVPRMMTGQGRGAPPFSLFRLGPLMGASASWTLVALWCPSLASTGELNVL